VSLSDQTLKLWDWSTNTVLLNLTWLTGISSGSFFKILQNGLLVVPNNSSTSKAYDLKSAEVKFLLNGAVRALEQLSNGNLLTATTDNYLRIWNSQTGQLIYQLSKPSVTYFSLRQTSIPNLVAAGSNGGSIVQLMVINTLSVVKTLIGDSNSFMFLENTPSGLLVGASGVAYNGLKLWNVNTGVTLGSIVFGTTVGTTTITCLKVVSNQQLVVSFQTNSIQFVNITAENNLTSVQTVNLITSSQVYDMRLTMEDILLLAQADGSVFFMDINTKSFLQALSPVSSTSVAPINIDLIGLFYDDFINIDITFGSIFVHFKIFIKQKKDLKYPSTIVKNVSINLPSGIVSCKL
jgi:WD40 repeat protein